ncbi:MAG TPA: DUF485 domain-containing protein [Longimicrobium sp.]|nr:DUF485 domain-containing protein [Longimicrobium sp.]
MTDSTPPPHPAPPAAPQSAWSVVEAEPQFRELVAAKRRFIVPATLFFIAYYFALPILVGYFPGVMDRDVFGNINLAYLFALSQFVMAWAVMWLYVRRARHFDALEHTVVQRHAGRSM